MKILAIRLENLASLAGRHELDFTSAPLAEQGLFAITGPTGAGKSTLLDALCLALYGNTPRLRLAPSRDSQLPDAGGDSLTTADARTLLRRGCAAGYAEVDFVGRDRRRYRARWSVRRARDRVDGRLQAAEQSLTDLDDQRLLTAQKREFDRLLPERLGLSFEQFTRAVLLAQSEFAAFLKADDNARSDLLEKLTDTDIYSRISMAAYRRSKEALQVVRDLEQRLSGEAPADGETRAHLESEAAGSERDLANVQSQITRLKNERQWLEQEHKLTHSVDEVLRRYHEARRTEDRLAPLRQREDALTRLAPQRHRFSRRAELDRQSHEAEHRLALTRQALEQAEAHYLQAVKEREQASARLSTAELERTQAYPLIEAARELASQLAYYEQIHRDKTAGREQARTSLEDDRRRHDELQRASERQRHELKSLEVSLQAQVGEHGQAASARRALQEQEDRAGQRRLSLQALHQQWQQWHSTERRLTDLRSQQQADRDEQAIVLNHGRVAATDLERLEHEYRQLQISIEQLRAARSESVVQLRKQLEPDHPCPVCGSLAHPYREAPPAEPAQAMLQATEREEQRQLDKARAAVEQARERHHILQGQYRALQARLTQNQTQIEQLEHDVASLNEQVSNHPDGPTLRAQGDKAGPWLEQSREQAEHDWETSRQALDALEATQRRIEPLRQALQAQDVELGKLASRCEQSAQQLAALDSELAPLQTKCVRLRKELHKALGDHASPHSWHQRVESDVEHARQQFQEAQAKEQQALTKRHTHQQTLEHVGQQEKARRTERDELEKVVDQWRAANADIDDALLAQLLDTDDEEHQRLRRQLQDAERERHTADISLKERRLALLEHRRQRFPEASEESLLDASINERITDLSERLDSEAPELNERLADTQARRDTAVHALHDDDQRRERYRALGDEMEKARREQNRWGSISELIGSADGKAFRRIAQGYNLEQLLDHANTHLAALSRRYRLTRGGSELGILVIDGDMGDEQRSAHSLSGGETFLVSLALALGLASMASGQLRIESLFIDEGFGSLDPQSLAIAMETLDGLQAQGRRVGVISHVQEMHERIPLQIRIEPQGNGASRLSITKGYLR